MKKCIFLLTLLFQLVQLSAQQYKNFKVSIYCRAYETAKMGDENYIKPIWDEITRQLKVDKVYLETHRDQLIVDQKTLDAAKKFFRDRGIEVAGGITYTISEPNRFETYCYSNPEHRKKVKEIAEYTARNFDEVILDDFFFTNCKCDFCIKARGKQSWTDYRLALMTAAGKDLVVGPAKAVNPKVKVIIKYPNWYGHFQGLGFDLENGPKIFDGIYTGTETRDARSSAQHLQEYLGYNIMRYFENLKPAGNGGGWVDPGGAFVMDRYAEQLWITLFAKARELTLFDIRQLSSPSLRESLRAPWQGQGTSFDFDAMMKPVNYNGGEPSKPTSFARAAGYTFEKVDSILGMLGTPVGIKSYRPYHSTGEDFLHNYLGMIGLPIELLPRFPKEASMILLTEEAAFDPELVDKIKAQVQDGKSVVITSGLLSKLQGKGIEDIAEIRYTDRKALVNDFGRMGKSEKAILIPQIMYLTNDSWEQVSAYDGTNGWPILHEAGYAKGKLYVLTIPDNFSDLYQIPAPALNRIRELICVSLPVVLEAPGQVSIFLYDNNTFIVESFRPESSDVKITAATSMKKITDLQTGEVLNSTERRGWNSTRSVFSFSLKPHSFRVFRIE
ncbi:MAG: hypothetical protein U0T82_06110 [Bacteroidales bacterium]